MRSGTYFAVSERSLCVALGLLGLYRVQDVQIQRGSTSSEFSWVPSWGQMLPCPLCHRLLERRKKGISIYLSIEAARSPFANPYSTTCLQFPVRNRNTTTLIGLTVAVMTCQSLLNIHAPWTTAAGVPNAFFSPPTSLQFRYRKK